MNEYVLALKKHLSLSANVQNAVQMQQYMRNQFVFLGIKAPQRKTLFKDFIQSNGLPNEKEWKSITAELWQLPEREFQYIGIELAEKYISKTDISTIELLEQLITQKSWWDTVDMIASHLVGTFFKKFPDQVIPQTEKWLKSENIWLIRTCILFQLSYKNQTNEALLFDFIRQNTSSKEFFIQKAIGWALRNYSKTNEKAVKNFVVTEPLAELSRKEALKWLNRKE